MRPKKRLFFRCRSQKQPRLAYDLLRRRGEKEPLEQGSPPLASGEKRVFIPLADI
jgi:hypothetical protein